MSPLVWRRIIWCYHLLFLAAVTWPGQEVIRSAKPFVFGLPLQMAWISAWILGSFVALWRLDSARTRAAGDRSLTDRPSGPGPGESRLPPGSPSGQDHG